MKQQADVFLGAFTYGECSSGFRIATFTNQSPRLRHFDPAPAVLI